MRLDGLRGLTTVQDRLYVSSNASLESLAGLDGLQNVGAMTIYANATLTTMGTRSAAAIGGISVAANPSLVDLEGFPGARVDRLYLEDNDALLTLSGLGHLRTLDRLEIADHALLRDVTALHGLEEVRDRLLIWHNPSLAAADAEALRDAIETLGDHVSIAANGP